MVSCIHLPTFPRRFARGDAVLLSTQDAGAQDSPGSKGNGASTTVARLESTPSGGVGGLESMSDEEDGVLVLSGYRYVGTTHRNKEGTMTSEKSNQAHKTLHTHSHKIGARDDKSRCPRLH